VSDRLGQLGTFCTLTPVVDEAALRAELAGWEESPYARLEHVHFARFVVIERVAREDAAQPDDRLDRPYLMASAFFDGDPEAWPDALPDEVVGVFRHCAGWPGPGRRAFRRWLLAHRVEATAVFGAYPDAPVGRVRAALAFRERFRELAYGRTTKADFLAFDAGEGA
jgi:hypothetical protein